MEVQRVEWVNEGEHRCPHTFFSLDARTQMEYYILRKKYFDLNGTVKGLGWEERKAREKEIIDPFLRIINLLRIINPKVELENVFLFYDGTIHLESIGLILLEEKKFRVAYKIEMDFKLEPEIQCSSWLEYIREGDGDYKDQIVRDIVRRVFEGEGDGIKKPIIQFSSLRSYIASIGYVLPVLCQMEGVLKKLGKNVLQELEILYGGYQRWGGSEETALQQKVFKEAYEDRLTAELIEKGLMACELQVVK